MNIYVLIKPFAELMTGLQLTLEFSLCVQTFWDYDYSVIKIQHIVRKDLRSVALFAVLCLENRHYHFCDVVL